MLRPAVNLQVAIQGKYLTEGVKEKENEREREREKKIANEAKQTQK